MRASEALALHREVIRSIVHAHKVENPRFFGSVATGTDDDESDLDLLIDSKFRACHGMRNRLIHDYDEIDLGIVWKTASVVIPALRKLTQVLP